MYVGLPSGTVRSFTLWRSGADGSAPFQLLGPNVFVKYQSPRFSPDGQHLTFAAVGTPQGYSPPAGLDLLRAFFVPEVAYADGDLWDMWSIDVDGRNLHRLTSVNEDLPVLTWSPDGNALAYLGGGSTITAQGGVTVIDAATGSPLARLSVQPGHRGLDWTGR